MNNLSTEHERAEMLAQHLRAEMGIYSTKHFSSLRIRIESANMTSWSSEEGIEVPSDVDTVRDVKP